MLIEVGILKSKINTDNDKLLDALYRLYSFKIPGIEFSRAYQRNRGWSGKKHFISRGGVFRTGLLSRVLEDLKKIGCNPELVFEETPSEEYKEWVIPEFTYYDYQESLIKEGLSKKRAVIKSPTGSGKTLIMAGLVKALIGKKMVLLFNSKQLLKQAYDFFIDDCNLDNIGLCFGEGYIYGDIMLCTVQSIEKILDTHLEEAEVLMVDECHEFCNGKTTLPAIQAFPKALYRYGFTATTPTEDISLYNLEGALGQIIISKTAAELITQGKLTKPIIQLVKVPYTEEEVATSQDMSYLEVYDTFIINNKNRNKIIEDIVNDIRKENKGSRILILTKTLDHGRALENLFGEGSQFLEGANTIGERYQAISRFRGYKGSSVLIGTKILQTGVNIKEITHLINARGMKSEIATLQALGRALRRHESKEVVYIYDFLDKVKYLKKHSSARKKHYKKEGHEIIIL